MPSGLFVGIDLAVSKSKRLPVAAFAEDGRRPLPLRDFPATPPNGIGNLGCLDRACIEQWVRLVVEYLDQLAAALGPIRRIAIDAPSDRCSGDRRCEIAVRKELGSSVFKSPTDWEDVVQRAQDHRDSGGAPSRLPNSNRLWMLAGYALWTALRDRFECREVHPNATVKALARIHGRKGRLSHKSTELGFGEQLELLGCALRRPVARADVDKAGYGQRHDKLDAVLSAYVAMLGEDDIDPMGGDLGDTIVVPRFRERA